MSTTFFTTATSDGITARESKAINPTYTFNFRWNALKRPSNFLTTVHEAEYITAVGSFHCSLTFSTTSWRFNIYLARDNDKSAFEHLKTCDVKSLSGKHLASSPVTCSIFSGNILVILIPHTQVEVNEGYSELSFTLSDRPLSVVAVTPPSVSAPSIGDNILERLYNDIASQDVFFVLNNVVEDDATTGWHVNDEKPDTMGGNQVPPFAGDTACFGVETTLGAHRLVLSQWPYFKTMFEGGFMESSPAEKRILIKDVNVPTFKLLLRFMYMGTLPLDAQPKNVCMSGLTKLDVSWEQVFVAAHRYNIPELYQWAQEKILRGLTHFMSVDLLFRTAYLYDELRGPLIKYIAQNCGNQVSCKTTRDRYKDHPDIVDILGELFELYVTLHK